jgi:hypothetical protein
MPTGATVAEPVPVLALRLSSAFIKERRRSCWTFVSSAESVSRPARSRAPFCINSLPVRLKPGIPPIFPKFKPRILGEGKISDFEMEDKGCLKS